MSVINSDIEIENRQFDAVESTMAKSANVDRVVQLENEVISLRIALNDLTARLWDIAGRCVFLQHDVAQANRRRDEADQAICKMESDLQARDATIKSLQELLQAQTGYNVAWPVPVDPSLGAFNYTKLPVYQVYPANLPANFLMGSAISVPVRGIDSNVVQPAITNGSPSCCYIPLTAGAEACQTERFQDPMTSGSTYCYAPSTVRDGDPTGILPTAFHCVEQREGTSQFVYPQPAGVPVSNWNMQVQPQAQIVPPAAPDAAQLSSPKRRRRPRARATASSTPKAKYSMNLDDVFDDLSHETSAKSSRIMQENPFLLQQLVRAEVDSNRNELPKCMRTTSSHVTAASTSSDETEPRALVID